MTYGITAWGSAGNSKLDKIFAIQKRCIRILYGKKLSYDHAEFYQTCARVRPYNEHVAPKSFTSEHTKPLFKLNKFLTVHNMHKLYTVVEVFKIIKYKTPISLSMLIQLNTLFYHSTNKNRMTTPHYKKQKSRNQFLYQSSNIWNKFNDKIFIMPSINKKLNIVIPGSCKYSDLSSTVNFVKQKFKKILLKLQNFGNEQIWQPSNIDIMKFPIPSLDL